MFVAAEHQINLGQGLDEKHVVMDREVDHGDQRVDPRPQGGHLPPGCGHDIRVRHVVGPVVVRGETEPPDSNGTTRWIPRLEDHVLGDPGETAARVYRRCCSRTTGPSTRPGA